MATLITSSGPKYIPDHIRLTGLEITDRDKKMHTHNAFNGEMKEIRELEAAGIILVDHLTASEVHRDQLNKRAGTLRLKGGKRGRPKRNWKNR